MTTVSLLENNAPKLTHEARNCHFHTKLYIWPSKQDLNQEALKISTLMCVLNFPILPTSRVATSWLL